MAEKRKPTVCVDLDGVLAQYSGWKGLREIGEPIEGAVQFMKDLNQFANTLVYTTRTNPDVQIDEMPEDLKSNVRDWLDKNDFVYYDVYTGPGKPLANAYIDDRAVRCQPQGEWALAAFKIAMEAAYELCHKKPEKQTG